MKFDYGYIHPNFDPTDMEEYSRVINIVRNIAIEPLVDKIVVSQHSYNVLEDAAHESMKGRGHQCYGKEVVIG